MNGAHARRGFSSVLTSVIMVGVVLSIGISIWGVTHSAATVMRSDYYDDVMYQDRRDADVSDSGN